MLLLAVPAGDCFKAADLGGQTSAWGRQAPVSPRTSWLRSSHQICWRRLLPVADGSAGHKATLWGRTPDAHVHSITFVACSKSTCGMVNPRASAVFRLMTRSIFAGCSIGRSPGFAPLKILSMYVATRRTAYKVSTP